jgi:MoxR-like ATPase
MQVAAPLITCVGASNTWSDSANQAAFFDRWLIRRTVKPVSESGLDRLIWDPLPPVTPCMTLADIEAAHLAAMALPIAPDTRPAMQQIAAELRSAGIRPSNRRFKKAPLVSRAAALIDGSTAVEPRHLEVLADVLWDDPNEHPEKAREIIERIANPTGAKVNEILREADELIREAQAKQYASDNAGVIAAMNKLTEAQKEIDKLTPSGNGRAKKASKFITRELGKIRARFMGNARGQDRSLVRR